MYRVLGMPKIIDTKVYEKDGWLIIEPVYSETEIEDDNYGVGWVTFTSGVVWYEET